MAPTSSGRTLAPVAMILGSCTSLQFGAALAAQLFGELGSWGVTALRLGIAAIVLGIVIRPAVHRWNRAQWRSVLLFGLAMGAMNGCFYASIERIPLGTAVAIEFLGPLVVAAVLSRRRLDLVCVLVALLGVSLFGVESFSGAGSLDLVGVAFALVAAVFWGAYILCSASVGALVPGHGSVAVAMGVGALLILPLGAGGVAHGITNPHLLLLALGCSLLASVIPYTLELSALRRLPRNVFGVLLSLEPAIAALAGLLLLGQAVTLLGIIAIGLVILASMGTTLAPRPAAVAVDDAEDPGTGTRVSTDTTELPAIGHVAGEADLFDEDLPGGRTDEGPDPEGPDPIGVSPRSDARD